jgi:hypothetical protein
MMVQLLLFSPVWVAMALTYMLLDELQVLCILRAVVGELDTREQGRDEVVVRWIDAVFDLAVGHPGQVARFAVKGIRRDFGGRWDDEPAIGEGDVGRCESGAGERQLQERGSHGGRISRFDFVEAR